MTDPLRRPGEAAQQLGVHRETVKRWMRKGVIAYEEVGPHRVKRIRQSVIDAQRSTCHESSHSATSRHNHLP